MCNAERQMEKLRWSRRRLITVNKIWSIGIEPQRKMETYKSPNRTNIFRLNCTKCLSISIAIICDGATLQYKFYPIIGLLQFSSEAILRHTLYMHCKSQLNHWISRKKIHQFHYNHTLTFGDGYFSIRFEHCSIFCDILSFSFFFVQTLS